MMRDDLETIKLRSRRFRVEREADWLKLEVLLDRALTRSAKALSKDELLELPRAYRSTLSALSVARATSLDKELINYLESLCTQAYFFIYGTRSTFWERVFSFFGQGWPRAVRSLWRETLASALVTFVSMFAAFMLTQSDPDWYYSFMPADLAGDRTPAASTESLRAVLYDKGEGGDLSVFSASLFTHNASVAIFAFALGFAFCVPTVLLLVYNGFILGAIVALYAERGLGFEIGGWLLIHGVTEIFAIILAGAAGLRIGWSVVSPGKYSRLAAAAEAGKTAAVVLAGVVLMLAVAGLLEGFGRQLIAQDTVRYGIAATSALLWGAYFYGHGTQRGRS